MKSRSPDGLRRVVKLGGSLLDLPDLTTRLRRWIVGQPPALNVLIVGGGPLVDLIRDVARLHTLETEPAHWLCIRAMSLTAEITAGLFDEMDLVRQLGELPVTREVSVPFVSQTIIFDPDPFLRNDEPSCHGNPLPHGWHITSDSIAARLAVVLDADELVLLKSASRPTGDFEEAAREGYVDQGFPLACRDVRSIRCVDLRARSMAIATHAR